MPPNGVGNCINHCTHARSTKRKRTAHTPDLLKSHNPQLLFQFITRLLKRRSQSIKFTNGTCNVSRDSTMRKEEGHITESLFLLVKFLLQLLLSLQKRIKLPLQVAVLVVQALQKT